MTDMAETLAQLQARAKTFIVDTIIGTDLFTVEIGGAPDDVILTRKDAEYLHWKLALVLGLPCEDEGLTAATVQNERK